MPQLPSSRHPCFALTSQEELFELQQRIYAHFKEKSESACLACDEPGGENTGSKVSLQIWTVGEGATGTMKLCHDWRRDLADTRAPSIPRDSSLRTTPGIDWSSPLPAVLEE